MDGRALHPGVRAAVGRALEAFGPERAGRPLRVLEVGGGAGGAFPRWLALVAPFPAVEFTATDRDEDLLGAYREEVRTRAGAAGLRPVHEDAAGLRLAGERRLVEVRLRPAAVPGGFGDFAPGSFDLLLAQSFWDLVPSGAALSLGRRLLAPGGVFYGTLTFSGVTRFDPPHPLDVQVLARYHASMGGERGGDPGAGERLIRGVRAPGSGFSELASGRSDWRVAPGASGYPGDEAFFVETVLGFFDKELRAASDITPRERADWLGARYRQLADGRLRYGAHQHDLAARREGGPLRAPALRGGRR